MNTNDFIAEVLMSGNAIDQPMGYCHKPIVIREGNQKLGEHLTRFNVSIGRNGAEVIENDVILLWDDNPRIISGADILGRLFRGIGKKIDSGESQTHKEST